MKFLNINLRKKVLSLVVGICVVGTVSAAGIAINTNCKSNPVKSNTTTSASTVITKGVNKLEALDTTIDSTSSEISSSSSTPSSSSSESSSTPASSSSDPNIKQPTVISSYQIDGNTITVTTSTPSTTTQTIPDPAVPSPHGNPYPDTKTGS